MKLSKEHRVSLLAYFISHAPFVPMESCAVPGQRYRNGFPMRPIMDEREWRSKWAKEQVEEIERITEIV